MRQARACSTFAITMMLLFAFSGTAAAELHIDDLDAESLLGPTIFSYDFEFSERVIGPVNVSIGHDHKRTGYGASRFVLGERGAVIDLGYKAMFFPLHAFSFVEITDPGAGAHIEEFSQDVLWRASWSEQRRGFSLNFAYTVDGTTHHVFAQRAILTPDFLVMSLNDDHTLRIIKYSAIEGIEVTY